MQSVVRKEGVDFAGKDNILIVLSGPAPATAALGCRTTLCLPLVPKKAAQDASRARLTATYALQGPTSAIYRVLAAASFSSASSPFAKNDLASKPA